MRGQDAQHVMSVRPCKGPGSFRLLQSTNMARGGGAALRIGLDKGRMRYGFLCRVRILGSNVRAQNAAHASWVEISDDSPPCFHGISYLFISIRLGGNWMFEGDVLSSVLTTLPVETPFCSLSKLSCRRYLCKTSLGWITQPATRQVARGGDKWGVDESKGLKPTYTSEEMRVNVSQRGEF